MKLLMLHSLVAYRYKTKVRIVKKEIIIFIQEMFEGEIDSTLWPVVVGGSNNNDCGTLSSGLSLVLNNAGRRYVTTSYLQLTESTCAQFTLQIGSATDLMSCQMINGAQNVVFGYSLTGGTTWIAIRTFE